MFSQIYHFIRKSKKTIRVDQKLRSERGYRSVGRVGENPGNEVEVDFELQAGIISFLDFLRKEHVIQKN